MIINGIAHNPQLLHEKSELPSGELVYLATRALKEYRATHVFTSLAPGWEQALAKACVERKIPYTVAIPYPGRDAGLPRESRMMYLDLLTNADEVFQVASCYRETAIMECHRWRVDNSEITLALWDFEFKSDVFQVIDYAIKKGSQVVNLWNDWQPLYNLRRKDSYSYSSHGNGGAQVFRKK